MLREQCRTWMGITSVAIYWPLMYFQQNNTESLQDAINTVQSFHESMEAEGGLPTQQFSRPGLATAHVQGCKAG